jgi:ABC-type nitrate/sulfonate/bicarbonate transport system substrate-binding protein
MRRLAVTVLAVLGLLPAAAQTPPGFPTPMPHPLRELRVIVFAGGFNLPLWVAERNGYFTSQGLEIRLTNTPGSIYQMTNLLAGNYDIAMTAIDNVVAYDEGQGQVPVPPNPDLIAVLGSDDAFLSLITQPADTEVPDLRGKTLTVDAMTTGFAFVLEDLLQKHGIEPDQVRFIPEGGVADRYVDLLHDKQHAGTVEMTPFDLLAEQHGLRVLVRVSAALGPYQGIVAAVRRSWAEQHRSELLAFIRAYKEVIDWLYNPANRKIAEAILVAHIPSMTFDLAHSTCDILLAPHGGFFRDVTPSIPGIRAVLALRTKYGQPHKNLTEPMKYVDLSDLHQALTTGP